MKYYFEDLFQHHIWRIEKFETLFSKIDPKYLDMPVDGSFGSLNDYFKHLVLAEYIWLKRLRNEQVDTFPEFSFNTWNDVFTQWKQFATIWPEWIQQLKDDEFLRKVEYTNTQGITYKMRLFEILISILDHCTYHCGQIITALRSLKLEVVNTNYLTYCREKYSNYKQV